MRAMKLIRVLVLSALAFSLASCYATKESQVVGTYEAQCSCLTVTLVVRADHTFEQVARDSKREVTAHVEGMWSFGDDGIVTFKPFLGFTGRFVRLPHDDVSRPGGYYAYDPHGERFDSAGFRPEAYLPGSWLMGPDIITCPNNGSCKADYIRTKAGSG